MGLPALNMPIAAYGLVFPAVKEATDKAEGPRKKELPAFVQLSMAASSGFVTGGLLAAGQCAFNTIKTSKAEKLPHQTTTQALRNTIKQETWHRGYFPGTFARVAPRSAGLGAAFALGEMGYHAFKSYRSKE